MVELKKGVGLIGVVTLGAGVAIGVSVFTVFQPAAEVAGSGLLVALALAALPMLPFALAYAYLAAIYPVSGASYEWPRRYLHPTIGFAIAWMRIIANVGVQVILAQVFAQYLNMVIAVPTKLVMAALITSVFALNYVGVSVAARTQTALMALLLAALAVFVVAGFPHVTMDRIGDPFAAGWPAIGACVVLMITLFMGIESAVEIGEEVRNGRRTIPMGIALAVGLTTIVYGLVAFVALGVAGPQRLATSSVPILEAARGPMGAAAVPLIVTAALVSVLKSMNANALVFSRSVFAMARTAALPVALSRVHPRFGTPSAAILACWTAAMLGLLLPSSLVFLLIAVNIPTMLKYGACSLSAISASRQPAPEGAEPLLGRRTVHLVGTIGALAALAIILAGLGADWRPHLLVGGWLVIGLAYYSLSRRRAAAKAGALERA
jgi:APA family basic amino acid/polyamine antiporter